MDKSDRPSVNRGRWSENDKLRLLGYLAENLRNYEEFKVNGARVAERIAVEVLGGRRTGEAVRGQWESLKRKYHTTSLRLRSTGEGQRDDVEKWRSIKLGWLDDMCPHYELIDDILQRCQ